MSLRSTTTQPPSQVEVVVMRRITLYKFFSEAGYCHTVTEQGDKLVCDCIDFFRFGSCDHSLTVELEQTPHIIYKRLR